MENSGFVVREVGVDGTLPPLDLKPAALASDAQNFDTKAAAAGVVGISSLIAKRRVREQKTGNLPAGLREAAFERATVQILDKLQGHSDNALADESDHCIRIVVKNDRFLQMQPLECGGHAHAET
jgi:hypothetical protein